MMKVGWRIANNAAVDAVVSGWTAGRTRQGVVETLSCAGVACSLVRSTDDVMRWPQLLEREMIVRLVNPLTGAAAAAMGPGFPIKFSRTPVGYDTPAPVPGAHSEEVFARFADLSAADVRRLRGDGII